MRRRTPARGESFSSRAAPRLAASSGRLQLCAAQAPGAAGPCRGAGRRRILRCARTAQFPPQKTCRQTGDTCHCVLTESDAVLFSLVQPVAAAWAVEWTPASKSHRFLHQYQLSTSMRPCAWPHYPDAGPARGHAPIAVMLDPPSGASRGVPCAAVVAPRRVAEVVLLVVRRGHRVREAHSAGHDHPLLLLRLRHRPNSAVSQQGSSSPR